MSTMNESFLRGGGGGGEEQGKLYKFELFEVFSFHHIYIFKIPFK